MKIFLDTNILVDVIEQRDGHTDCERIMATNEIDDCHRVYTSFLAVADIAYICRKKGKEAVIGIIKSISKNVNVLSMNSMILQKLDEFRSPDIEDCIQICCAEIEGCTVIITDNVEHFKEYTDIPVFSPQEFVALCG